jgi:predicted ATPase/DNA-binding SARP family transcriptional activator
VTSTPDQRIRAAVLGPVLIDGARGTQIEPPGAMARNLITALVLAPHASLSTAGLVDDLWADAPPRNEKAALQTLVSRVRSVCAPDLIASTNNGYRLAIDQNESDYARAGALRDRARLALAEGDDAGAELVTSEALDLWRGEPGADLGDTELSERIATAASDIRHDLLRLRASARFEHGDHTGALADLEPLVHASALDEDLQLLRMRVVAASGRRNDALRQFSEFRERLRDELGTSPSSALVEFNAELLREDLTAGTVPKRVRIGLRSSPNELVGRDSDIDAITELLKRSRLTTILGAGGLGKTRLAQELAHRASETTPAVIVVELASVRNGEDVTLALASTLGVGEASGTRLKLTEPGARRDVRSRILSALAEQQTLLVMDNCEHIVDAVAAWVADILDSVASVRVLSTSRSPLQIAAEHVYALEPLSSTMHSGNLPPAVTLFIERARAARPSASLPTDTIARLCDRLDGLPLAIELAAARIRSMSVEEIERRLGNRFALLTTGDRTAPERHRTLLAVIDWSWNLLRESERRMLRRLSRFPDGFSADAARIVASVQTADALDGTDMLTAEDDLESLVNQSLVSVVESSRTGSIRYRMLETVREFGEMALTEAGEDAQVTEALFAWASAFSVVAWRTTYGPDQIPTFARVNEEQDNLVAVLRTAIDRHRGDVIVSVFVTLAFHWSIRGAHTEVMSLSQPVFHGLAGYQPDAEHTEAAIGAWAVIAGTSLIADLPLALRAIARTKTLARGHVFEDAQLGMLIQLMLSLSNLAEAQKVLAAHRTSADPLVAAFANVMSAQLSENDGELDVAVRYASAGYASAVSAGDSWLTGMAAVSLAQLYSQRAHSQEALEWARTAEPSLRALEAEDDMRQLEWVIAVNQVSSDRPDAGRATLERMAAVDAESAGFDYADLRSIGISGLAEIAANEGDLIRARQLYAQARDVFDETKNRRAPWSITVTSAFVATSIRAGATNDLATLTSVRRLRIQVLVSQRMRSGYSDRPVLGSGLLGIALWILAPDRSGATAAEREAGVELLALSRALSGREDMPALNWERASRETLAWYRDADIGAAPSRACALTMDDRTSLAMDLLRDQRLRAAFAPGSVP